MNVPSGQRSITFSAPCVSISKRMSSPAARRTSIGASGVP